jgi:very-short-patch-repair endonuclease
VLSNGSTCLSERGTADLLCMKHPALRNMVTTGVPKTLKPFINNDFSMVTTLVEVTANNSPYKGRNIVVYNSNTIGTIIRAYAMAEGNKVLQKNQMHIGQRCVILLCSLVITALETAIQQACGITPNIQQTVQEQCIKLMKQFGLKASFPEEIYTKKDIINFLDKPLGTLNSYLKTHDIPYEKLDHATIKANGGTATHMNAYSLESVSKIVLGIDSMVGIELKKQIFGNTGTLARTNTKGEIEWQQVLAQVFDGFGFYHNYSFGSYRVDFFIKDLNLILECNGYHNHCYYNQEEERQREQLLKQNYSIIRFNHQITLEQLFNGILKTKMGKVVRLYDIEPLYPNNCGQSKINSNESLHSNFGG